MIKRGIFVVVLFGVVLTSLLGFMGHNLTGFATYNPGNLICGQNVVDDSTFSGDNDCSLGGGGGTMNTAGVTLNCQGFYLWGDNAGSGFTTTANGVIIKNCHIRNYNYNLDINSNARFENILLDNSIIEEARITTGSSATFLNVSFTDANVDVQGTANITVQHYLVVNVTNDTADSVSGATVCINATGGAATNACGTTDASGFVYFNVTDRFLEAGPTTTSYVYSLNATKSGYNINVNNSFDPPQSTSDRIFVSMNISGIAGDSTPPGVTIVNPKNATYGAANVTSGILFNVTLSETGTANFTLDGGLNNYSMTTTDNLHFGAVNDSITSGSYTAKYYAWDASGNLNATENVTFSVDAVRPLVTIASPTSQVYTTATPSVNITLNEAGNCVYSVNDGVTNLTLTSGNGGKEFTGTTSSLSNAEYNISAYCSDGAGNKNESEKMNFTISASAPPSSCFIAGTLIKMADGSEKKIEDVNLGDMVLGYDYRKDKFVAEEVLELEAPVREGYYLINGKIGVTDEHPFYTLKDGKVVWAAIDKVKAHEDLWDSELRNVPIYDLEVGDKIFGLNKEWVGIESMEYYAGDVQTYNLKTVDVMNVFFADGFLVHNKDGGCTVSSWDCGIWEACLLPPGSAFVGTVFGEQSRSCTSNCGSRRVETQVCNITFSDDCENQCGGIGDRCNGNSVESCELVDGCFKIVNIEDCGSSSRCENGICVEIVVNSTVGPFPDFGDLFSEGYGHSDLPLPSDFIPGNPVVVNTASAAAGASLLWLLIWLIWMAVSVPFFLRKLNHHSISIFDSANELKIFDKKGKIDNGRMLEFLEALQKSYGRLVFAEKDSEMIKYLVEEGFIEVRLDRPFVVMGHFTDSKHAKIYGQVMKHVLERFKAGNVKVMEKREGTTMFRALRAYMRERRAKKMLRRAFEK